MPLSPRIFAFAQIMRVRVSAGSPVLTVVGDLTSPRHLAAPAVAASAAASFTAMCFAQVFNDVVDHNLDKLHKPDRPIPSDRISPLCARSLATTLALLSLMLSAVVGLPSLIVCVTFVILGITYSIFTKDSVLIGNLTVAIACGLMLVLGSVSSSQVNAHHVVIAAVVVAYIMGNELLKTGLDRDGDAAYGLHTIATQYGLRTTLLAVAVCAAFLNAIIFGVAIVGITNGHLVYASTLGISAPTIAGTVLALRKRDPDLVWLRKVHALWRAAWLPGLVIIMLVSI